MTGRTHAGVPTRAHTSSCCDLEVRHQPPRLQVQRVLVEAQLPVHHLLVVELKLDVTSRWNMDLGLKGLHVL